MQGRGKVLSAASALAKNGTRYVRVEVDGGFKFSVFRDPKILEMVGAVIDFEYEKQGNGYLNLINWAVVNGADTRPVPNSPYVEYKAPVGANDRQESIERQSAMAQATKIVAALLDKDLVDKKVAKDPDVVLEIVFDLATKIKWRVQSGDWSLPENYLVAKAKEEQQEAF